MKSTLGQNRWRIAGAVIVLLAAIVVLWKLQSKPEVSAGLSSGKVSSSVPSAAGSPSPQRRDGRRDVMPRALDLSELPPLPAPERPPHPPGSADNGDWIAATTATLGTLAWEDDPDSMRKILAELRNPLPEIRAAALDATRDFDDPAAIPYLRAISNDTVDPHEQKKIGELIETLTLPSLIESLDEQ